MRQDSEGTEHHAPGPQPTNQDGKGHYDAGFRAQPKDGRAASPYRGSQQQDPIAGSGAIHIFGFLLYLHRARILGATVPQGSQSKDHYR